MTGTDPDRGADPDRGTDLAGAGGGDQQRHVPDLVMPEWMRQQAARTEAARAAGTEPPGRPDNPAELADRIARLRQRLAVHADTADPLGQASDTRREHDDAASAEHRVDDDTGDDADTDDEGDSDEAGWSR